MSKKNILIVFGGKSSEHEVSRSSAFSIINNINKEIYNIYTLGITKEGEWILFSGDYENIADGSWQNHPDNKKAFITPDKKVSGLLVITNEGFEILNIDAIIPVLHGKNGEDGTIQGLFELSEIPYVGCDVLSSAICMDKAISNTIFAYNNIKQAKFVSFYIEDFRKNNDYYLNLIDEKIGTYPVFIKPANAGSSVGVSKVKQKSELIDAINKASLEDRKILIEEGIDGIEVECAIIGNNNAVASIVGEITPSNDFYDYNAKYIDNKSELIIPANISDDISQKIRETALKAYKAMGCSGLARIDFFVEKRTNRVLLNEINTFPGFTSISMYPMLMNKIGISFESLIDKLIDLAINKKEGKYETE